MNETRITVHGNVVSEPVERQGRNGSVFTTFRIATTPFRRTPEGKFLDLDTSFYSVISFNALAANAAVALKKGQPIIVEGNLSIRTWTGADGQSRTSAEIEADHVGHDLVWGRAAFERLSKAAALGYDRTADADVRLALAEANGDGLGRPANVDADGVIHDLPVAGDGTEAAALVTAYGDPDTDAYEVDEPLSA